MKNKFLSIVITLGIWTISFAQVSQIQIEQPYGIGEIVIKLNNWDLMRLDYTDASFRAAIGVQSSARVPWSAAAVQEFGHDYFVYNFGGNSVEISGSALDNSFYVAKFEIVNQALNINGIKVGDPIGIVPTTFAKHYSDAESYYVYYDDTAISFYHLNGVINKITYWTPL